MTVLKLLAFIVLVFIFIVTFSLVETKYKCIGELSEGEQKTAATMYIEIDKYRWWVLWADSHGFMEFEIPNTGGYFYPLLIKNNKYIDIHDEIPEKEYRGSFSTFSGALKLETKFNGLFKGECTRLDL